MWHTCQLHSYITHFASLAVKDSDMNLTPVKLYPIPLNIKFDIKLYPIQWLCELFQKFGNSAENLWNILTNLLLVVVMDDSGNFKTIRYRVYWLQVSGVYENTENIFGFVWQGEHKSNLKRWGRCLKGECQGSHQTTLHKPRTSLYTADFKQDVCSVYEKCFPVNLINVALSMERQTLICTLFKLPFNVKKSLTTSSRVNLDEFTNGGCLKSECQGMFLFLYECAYYIISLRNVKIGSWLRGVMKLKTI